MPVASYIIATEPLGENRAKSLIANNEAVANTNFIVDYFRRSSDHRMLFGGRASYSTMEPPSLAEYMRPRMTHVFPQLKDVKIDYAWGGYIAITSNRIPDCGRLSPTVYYAHGYSGQGVALTGLYGKLMAEAIRGTAERFDLLARVKHLPFPGGPMRTPMLVAAMMYYRIRDALSYKTDGPSQCNRPPAAKMAHQGRDLNQKIPMASSGTMHRRRAAPANPQGAADDDNSSCTRRRHFHCRASGSSRSSAAGRRRLHADWDTSRRDRVHPLAYWVAQKCLYMKPARRPMGESGWLKGSALVPGTSL